MKNILKVILALSIIIGSCSLSFAFSFAAENSLVYVDIKNAGFEESDPAIYYSKESNSIPGWNIFKSFTDKQWDLKQYPGFSYERPLFYGISNTAYFVCAPHTDAAYEGKNCLVIQDQDENNKPYTGQSGEAIYLYSDKFNVMANLTYELSYQFCSDYRFGEAMLFYDANGKVYKDGAFVDATEANEIALASKMYFVLNDFGLKGKAWQRRVTNISAPAGAVTARIAFYSSPHQTSNVCIDDVKLGYVPAVSLEVNNKEFQTDYKIPGWSKYFYTGNYNDQEYFCLSNKNKSTGNAALKIYKQGTVLGVYIYSDPIEVPKDHDNKMFKFSIDGMSDVSTTKKRGRYGIQFFQNGPDGVSGTNDDLVLSSPGSYNKTTYQITGGQYKEVTNKYNLSGTDNSRLALEELTSDWQTFNHNVIYASTAGDFDYVRVMIYQVVNNGGTSAYFDNVKLSFGDDITGFEELYIKNAGFEEDMEIEGWNSVGEKTQESTAHYMITDDEKVSGYLSLKIGSSGDADTIGVSSKAFAVIPGVSYNLNFAAKTNSNINYQVKFFNLAGQVYNTSTLNYEEATNENLFSNSVTSKVLTANTTENVQNSFTAPDDAAIAKIYLLSNINNATSAYYDNFNINFKPVSDLIATLPYLTRDEEIITNAFILNEGDLVHANVSLYNNTDEEKSVRLILVKYDIKGIMEKVVSETVTLTPRDPVTTLNSFIDVEVEMEVPSDFGTYKIFAWDDFYNMINISNPTHIIVK